MNIVYSSSLNGVSSLELFPEEANKLRKEFTAEKTRGKVVAVGRRCYEHFRSYLDLTDTKVWVISRYQRPIEGAERVMSLESLLLAQHQEGIFEDLWLLGGSSLISSVLLQESKHLYESAVSKALNELHFLSLGCDVHRTSPEDRGVVYNQIEFDHGVPLVRGGGGRFVFNPVSCTNYGLLTCLTLKSRK